MRPRRDYQTNRLVPGRLQLPPASQLLLDETTMAAGTLAPAGIANLQVRATGAPGFRAWQLAHAHGVSAELHQLRSQLRRGS